MAVNKQVIKLQVRNLIEKTKSNEDTEEAVEQFCEGISDIIVQAIQSATITAAPGSIVVVGGPTTQTNPAPIIFNIS